VGEHRPQKAVQRREGQGGLRLDPVSPEHLHAVGAGGGVGEQRRLSAPGRPRRTSAPPRDSRASSSRVATAARSVARPCSTGRA
jgi:hypothetical protein